MPFKPIEPLMYKRFDDEKEWTLASVVDDDYISMDEAMFGPEDARALRDWLSAALGSSAKLFALRDSGEVEQTISYGGTILITGSQDGRLETFTQTETGVERRVSKDHGHTWSKPDKVFTLPVLAFQVWVDGPRRRVKFIADLAPFTE